MNFHLPLFTGSGGCLSEAMLKLGALQDILRGGKGAVKNAFKIKIQVGWKIGVYASLLNQDHT